MKQGFSITHLACQGCKSQFGILPNFMKTLDDIEADVEQAHSRANIICPSPQMVVLYSNAMISDAIFEQLERLKRPIIHTANGH